MSRREQARAFKADKRARRRKTPPSPARPNPFTVRLLVDTELYVESTFLLPNGDREPVFADAQFTPLGQCPHHGLEPYDYKPSIFNTGYDTGIARRFTCGTIDIEGVF